MAGPTLAVFDFDGTITQQDSLPKFIRHSVGATTYWLSLIWLSPWIIGYKLKLIPNYQAKEKLFGHFFRGMTQAQLQHFGSTFAEIINPDIRPQALDKIRWHQAQGHEVVIVTASLENWVAPWAKTIGISKVIGTKCEVLEEKLTGKFLGQNCYGQEKVERLRQEFTNLEKYYIFAYGDSEGDREILEIADEPHFLPFR